MHGMSHGMIQWYAHLLSSPLLPLMLQWKASSVPQSVFDKILTL
jgi:hypothetical protein